MFAAKIAMLLKNHSCVSIVDVVSTSEFNLYSELTSTLQDVDPVLPSEPSPMYAGTVRT